MKAITAVFFILFLTLSLADKLWPKPSNQSTSATILYLDIDSFHFKSIGFDSAILQRAFDRYAEYLFDTDAQVPFSEACAGRVSAAERGIRKLKVYVASNDQSLNLQTDESYALIVSAPTSTLEANSVFGALRGLETFSQLVERIDLPDWDQDSEDDSTAQGTQERANSAKGTSLNLLAPHRRLMQGNAMYHAGSDQPFGIPVGSTPPPQQEAARSPAFSDSIRSSTPGSSNGFSDESYSAESSDEHELDGSEEWADSLGNRSDALEGVDSRTYGSEDRKDPVSEDIADADAAEDSDDADGALEKHHKKHKKHEKHKKRKKHHKKHHSMVYTINATAIWDSPRFAHRGLLLDSSRHFLPVSVIKENLDAMASVKMNVLHWHIVDDQSFPYQSNALPRLSERGAFSPNHIYSPGDVAEVVSYARDRGIRVIPEFDTPGHTASWGKGYPELLTDCYDAQERPTGLKGPINPARNETYALLWQLLREAATAFPDSYIHLGGDEVPFDCWQSSPEIRAFMAENGLKSVSELETYFEGRVLGLARQAGRNYIVWQEILDNNVQIEKDTVVHVWKWWAAAGSQAQQKAAGPAVCELSAGCRPETGQYQDAGLSAWGAELAKVTSKGYKALLSSPWYLNLGQYADEAWATYYKVEPLDFNGTPEQSRLVIGGEACMWGEWTDASNVVQETWPRAAATAERLWSARDVNDVDEARPRFKEHRCRMLARGIAASPGTGPGFCPTDYQD